jgi:integrase
MPLQCRNLGKELIVVRRSEGPAEPWIPTAVSVQPVNRKTTRARPRNGAVKAKEPTERPCWELRYRVDGREYKRRFPKSADANAWANALRYGHANRWPFSHAIAQFVSPDDNQHKPAESASEQTLFAWTETYWQSKWPELEPKGRGELARYLNRARRYFVTAPAGDVEAGLDAYLTAASLTVKARTLDDAEQRGRDWLEAHSRPLAGIDRPELEAFLAHYRQSERFPGRQVAPASERRMVADLRQCWARAAEEGVITSNPFDRIQLRGRSSSSGRVKTGRSALAADAELVLSPTQVWQLAEVCAEVGDWGDVVKCFVLLMGLCGLRPNEAVGLVVGDLELPTDGQPWVTVRRTRRRVAERYLEPEDDADWGPLKGRDLAATRRVPIPDEVADALRSHLETHCDAAAAHDLVFRRHDKPVDLSQFHDAVWAPARTWLFPSIAELPADSPLQPKLSRLRRHDLRHSACSLWLRSRVDVSVCQRWSGHKQLSVFLDIYQGLIPGREEEGVRLVNAQLNAERAASGARRRP